MIYITMMAFAAAFGMSCTLLANPNSTLGNTLAGGAAVAGFTLFTMVYLVGITGGAA